MTYKGHIMTNVFTQNLVKSLDIQKTLFVPMKWQELRIWTNLLKWVIILLEWRWLIFTASCSCQVLMDGYIYIYTYIHFITWEGLFLFFSFLFFQFHELVGLAIFSQEDLAISGYMSERKEKNYCRAINWFTSQ
jgi:hypothetical protein